MEVAGISIVRVPNGSDLPLWVRKAWVGLTLPIIGVEVVPCERWRTSMWGRVSRWFDIGIADRQLVYLVDFKMAFAILCRDRPEAAEWWLANHPGSETLVFSARCLSLVFGKRQPELKVLAPTG